MIRLVNPSSGGETWVHESRLEEYLERGFNFYDPPPPVPPRGRTTTPAKKPAKKAR